MKTYISDIIPKLIRFSERLDNLTLLLNQHWIVIDENSKSKCVYIFRENHDLLISQDGVVTKSKWEYLGNNSILIENNNGSFLFKHGFFNESVLALKLDNKEEYAFLVNENKIAYEIRTIEEVTQFLSYRYFPSKYSIQSNDISPTLSIQEVYIGFKTKHGFLQVHQPPNTSSGVIFSRKVLLDGRPAPDGKYKIGFLKVVTVKNSRVYDIGIS